MNMQSIIFATTNKGKIAELRKKLDRFGYHDISIDARSLDIIEPQANTCEEVARSKARQAYSIVKQPVLVDDSAFHIEALGGFPGVYAKYMLDTLGAEGIIEFMHDKTNRRSYFSGVLVYIDENSSEHVFSEAPYTGKITNKIYEIADKAPWSDLHKIFIPDGSKRVLGNMTPDDEAQGRTAPSKYTMFVEWLTNHGE